MTSCIALAEFTFILVYHFHTLPNCSPSLQSCWSGNWHYHNNNHHSYRDRGGAGDPAFAKVHRGYLN